MKKRQVFWTHPVLLIGGRLFCLLGLGVTLFLDGSTLYEWISTGTVTDLGLSVVVSLLCTALAAVVFYHFWPQCFCRLILSEDAVIWRCLFMRPRKITKDACRHIGIKEAMIERGKGKWVSTGTQWVWFSTQPFPEGNTISQLRTGKGFIKFPLSVRLSGALGEWLPEPKNLPFQSIYEKARLERKRRKERQQRKREKRQKKKGL